MTPCLLLNSVCTTPATIMLYGNELDDNGRPIVIFTGSVKGNFQMAFSQSINGTEFNQIKSGTYLVPASSIPFKNYNGGKMKAKQCDYLINEIVPCFDAFGDLNYWEINFS